MSTGAVLSIIFVLLTGDIKVSHQNFESMDACHVAGQKFNEDLQKLTDEDMVKMGVKEVLAYCDPNIVYTPPAK